MEPIAITGYSFRLPQGAEDDASFWEVLSNKRNLMTEWPEDRLNLEAFYDESRQTNMLYSRGGHFIKGDLSAFDAPFFHITASEAAAIDPAQRLALETSYHAFENAGLPLETLSGSKTAVISAVSTDDYARFAAKDINQAHKMIATGTTPSMLPARVSWFFNLKGPSMVVDTACSSSMVALDLACQYIRNGNASAAVVLGVNLMLGPECSLLMGNMSFLSVDSKCYSFDHRANGYGRGEGLAAIIIKPVSDAVRSGDMIRAVIRSNGTNQDGRTPGITQPGAEAQEAMIRRVYEEAKLGFSETRYVEAHGTGTPIGDPVEMKAIGRVFRKYRSSQEPLFVGSAKSNTGHLEGASGLVGIIKAILILESGIIPPNANFEKLNPEIDAEFYHQKIPTECIPWPTDGLRRISINSFGFGGTNSHLILDDAYHFLKERGLDGLHNTVVAPKLGNGHVHRNGRANGHTSPVNGNHTNGVNGYHTNDVNGNKTNGVNGNPTNGINGTGKTNEAFTTGFNEAHSVHRIPSRAGPQLIVLSGSDEAALKRTIKDHESYFTAKVQTDTENIDRFADTLSSHRTHMAWRSYAVVDAANAISDTVSLPMEKPTRTSSKKGLAFVFTGQGAQYANMGIELLRYPLFKSTLLEIDSVHCRLGCKWSIIDVIQDEDLINRPEYSQPICTALQIALVRLLESLGLKPSAVVGHSSGEIAAAFTIGGLSLESASKVAYCRGQVAGQLKSETTTPGAMLSVSLSRDKAEDYIKALGHANLHIACINSPGNVTVSGEDTAIDGLKEMLDKEQVGAQKLRTGVAYHSPAMHTIASKYRELLGDLEMGEKQKRSTATMISSVSGRSVRPADLNSPEYWVKNLVSPVEFCEAVTALVAGTAKLNVAGKDTMTDFVEVGPSGALRRPVQDILIQQNKKKDAFQATLLDRKKPASRAFLEAMGHLFCRGYDVSISACNLSSTGPRPFLVDLPKYPFDHSRTYWHESRISRDFRLRKSPPGDVLGPQADDFNPLEPTWRTILNLETMPWIGDHVVNGTTLFPGTGSVVMAIQAVLQTRPPGRTVAGFFIKEAEFINPILINPKGTTEVMAKLKPLEKAYEKESTWSDITIFAYVDERWSRCFTATIQVRYDDAATQVDGGLEKRLGDKRLLSSYQDLRDRVTKSIDKDEFYAVCRKIGLEYGDKFRLLEDIAWDENDGALACIDLSRSLSTKSIVHPTVLDAAVHLSLCQVSRGLEDTPSAAVPRELKNAWISAEGWQNSSLIRVMTIVKPRLEGPGITSMVQILGEDDTVLCNWGAMIMVPVSTVGETARHQTKLVYGMDWKPQLSLMSPEQLHQWCEAEAYPEDETGMLQYYPRLEAALYAVVRKTLKELTKEDRSKAPIHLQKLIAWMEDHAQSATSSIKLDMTDDELMTHLQELGAERPRCLLYPEVGRNLLAILRGQIDPLELVFTTGLAENYYGEMFDRNCDFRMKKFLELAGHENPAMRILEVGAGTGGMTSHVLKAFKEIEDRTGGKLFAEYVYTDITPAFFENTEKRFGDMDGRIRFKTFDLETEGEKQGFEVGAYDLVIAGSVLHATKDLVKTLSNLRRCLKAGGHIMYLEVLAPYAVTANLGFGVLPGWWLSVEDWRQHGPAIPLERWDMILKETGFSGNDLVLRDYGNKACHLTGIMVSKALEPTVSEPCCDQLRPSLVLITKDSSAAQRAMAEKLQHTGREANLWQSAETMSINDIMIWEPSPSQVVVVLLELDESLLYQISEQDYKNLQEMMRKAKKLLWVARFPELDDGSESEYPHQSLARGFMESMRSEDLERHFVTLSLESCEPSIDAQTQHVTTIIKSAFYKEDKWPETEYIVRDNHLQSGRLYEEITLNNKVRALISAQPKIEEWGRGCPVKLTVLTPGMLDTLTYIEDEKASLPLDDDEIEIKAKAWGLGFRDMFVALGRLPGNIFGYDCSGIVSRVGKNSEHKPGDRVFAASMGCMRSHPRTLSRHAIKIPDTLSFEAAASVISPGISSYYSLVKVARLQKGEKILIHSGAGSTGQMAIWIAKMIGAEVFATVGFDAKKEFLMKEFGIPADHIFYSRNTSFAQGIKRVTNGYGVDVVLNSLSGDGLYASLDCIAPYGRFIEIGKADIVGNSPLPMSIFANNVSFAAVDLFHLAMTKPDLGASLTRETMDLILDGHIQHPTPLNLYPVSQVEAAFRLIQSGKNTGRTIITMDEKDVVEKRVSDRQEWRCKSDASYLVAGGWGGIGRAILSWLADKGVKHLIVPSRSGGANSDAAKETMLQLKSRGVNVIAPACDVASYSSLSALLEECAITMPPIRGCIDGAMVLQDAIFNNMTHAQWELTIKSKAHTAWRLHQLLPKNLDFFIMLSSLAGMYGSPAQSNYAAGCTFQDSVAYFRASLGLKAVSFDIGWMRTIGIIAETKAYQQNRKNYADMGQIEEEELMALLDIYCDDTLPVLSPEKSQLLIGVVTPADLLAQGEALPPFAQRPIFTAFSQAPGGGSKGDESSVSIGEVFRQASSAEERAEVAEGAVVAKLSRALCISSEDIDTGKYLSDYGVDSLMAVELRNWIGNDFKANVAVFDIMGGTTISAIGELIASRSEI